jgi:integrase
VNAGEVVKAMTREQRDAFLATAAEHFKEYLAAHTLMSLSGLRIGEALGLKWTSVEFEAGKILVKEQLGHSTTKSGIERRVDLAATTVDLLRDLQARRREEAFAAGKPMGPYVALGWLPENPNLQEQRRATHRVRRSMANILRRAGLPRHFVCHSHRHTACSLLVSAGISPAFVAEQMGHSLTVLMAVYGSHFPVQVPGAMDRLAEGVGAVTGTPRADSGTPTAGKAQQQNG